MQILKWLLVNWDSVLLIAMVAALIIYLIKTGQTKILKQISEVKDVYRFSIIVNILVN